MKINRLGTITTGSEVSMLDRRKPAKLCVICCVSLLALCLAVVVLASCRSSAVAVPPIDSSAVQVITINDSWDGLSPAAPIRAVFRLQPATDCFTGTAQFSAGGYSGAVINRSVPITIPLPVIEEFAALLQSTPLAVGDYKPSISHTDDYPAITIAVKGEADSLQFYSESQGDQHIPWQVSIAGRGVFVSHSGIPAQALGLLDPYLAREVEEELIDQAQDRGW
jgi:hypothetical protein